MPLGVKACHSNSQTCGRLYASTFLKIYTVPQWCKSQQPQQIAHWATCDQERLVSIARPGRCQPGTIDSQLLSPFGINKKSSKFHKPARAPNTNQALPWLEHQPGAIAHASQDWLILENVNVCQQPLARMHEPCGLPATCQVFQSEIQATVATRPTTSIPTDKTGQWVKNSEVRRNGLVLHQEFKKKTAKQAEDLNHLDNLR